jgi:hypothetical protein
LAPLEDHIYCEGHPSRRLIADLGAFYVPSIPSLSVFFSSNFPHRWKAFVLSLLAAMKVSASLSFLVLVVSYFPSIVLGSSLEAHAVER